MRASIPHLPPGRREVSRKYVAQNDKRAHPGTAPAVTTKGTARGHPVRFGRPMFVGAREWLGGIQSGQDVRAPGAVPGYVHDKGVRPRCRRVPNADTAGAVGPWQVAWRAGAALGWFPAANSGLFSVAPILRPPASTSLG